MGGVIKVSVRDVDSTGVVEEVSGVRGSVEVASDSVGVVVASDSVGVVES